MNARSRYSPSTLRSALCLTLSAGMFATGCSERPPTPRGGGGSGVTASTTPESTPAPATQKDAVSGGAQGALMQRNKDGVIVNAANIPDEVWKSKLTPEQYQITRKKGTERAFTGKYWNTKDPGVYRCSNCGQVLFTSKEKFDSGCGWPSFWDPTDKARIKEHLDTSYGMVRTEVTCANCDAHLGHVFEDGPEPTGLRYCINSASIEHDPQNPATPAGADQSGAAEVKPEAKSEAKPGSSEPPSKK